MCIFRLNRMDLNKLQCMIVKGNLLETLDKNLNKPNLTLCKLKGEQ